LAPRRQGLFEGMKAVRRADGAIIVFRPEMNARRMAAGARRLCLPPVPEKLFLEVVLLLLLCVASSQSFRISLGVEVLGG
jgi:branched-subunit amino acid aminotransferase/4-amino-4-deoxychorismate lyase